MIDNINWYKFSQMEDRIFLDASIKDWIAPGLLAAFLAVMSGSGIWNAAQKYDVSEIELGNALKNPTMRQQVERYITEQDKETSGQAENIFNMNEKQSQQPNQQTQALTKEEAATVDIIARTLWGEARGESHIGQLAVASTIWNRSNGDPKRFTAEIKKPYAYSVWNDGKIPSQGKGETWNNMINIAKQMVKRQFTPTISYKSYFNPKKATPTWGYEFKTNNLVTPNLQIGEHVFLNPRQRHPLEIKKNKPSPKPSPKIHVKPTKKSNPKHK